MKLGANMMTDSAIDVGFDSILHSNVEKCGVTSDENTQITDVLERVALDGPCNCNEALRYKGFLDSVRVLGGSHMITVDEVIKCMEANKKSTKSMKDCISSSQGKSFNLFC
jgi:hypothetical protein